MIKNIMGHGPVCYIPTFMEIESLVPRDNVFKVFQNIWAWKPSGHVPTFSFPRTLKFTYKILSKKAKWFLLLALKFDIYVKYVKVNPWALFIHTMMCLVYMLHTKFRENRSSGAGEYFERFITYMGIAAILQFNFIFLV